MKIKIQITLTWIIAIGLLLSSCSSGSKTTATPQFESTSTAKTDGVVIAEGRVEPIRYAQIGLNSSGLVSEVLAKEGDAVKAGQVVARLKNTEAKTLDSAQADSLQGMTAAYQELRDTQFKMDEFDVPSDFAGLTPTQAVQNSLIKLNAARDAFEPYKWMSENQLKLTQAEEDNNTVITNTPKRLKRTLDDAWSIYRKAVEWLDDESAVASTQAKLIQAQNDYNSLQDASFAENTAGVRAALANAEVRSPFGGTITNLDLKVGEFAASGTPVVTIGDLSNWVIKTTDLTEIDVVNIKEGEPVTFTLDALPGQTLKGYVLSVAQNYTERQGDIVYKVTVLVSDKLPAMRWGMTAEVKFSK